MKHLLLCLAVTLGLCLGLGASAQAVSTAGTATAAPPGARAHATATAAAVPEVERLAPFLDTRTATLDAAGALEAGVDAQVVRELESGLTWGKTRRAVSRSLSAHEAVAQAAACAGRTAFYRKVVYVEIWMNDCDVRGLTGIMTAGGGVMAIAGGIISLTAIGIPIGVAVAIAGGLIAVGSGALQVCNRVGRGVVLDNAGWPCRSQ